METTILSKVLLVLSKTKEALLQDLEQEFVSIRKQSEDPENEEPDFETVTIFIEAIFARIGFDICHHDETKELKDLLKGLFKLTEKLGTLFNKVSKEEDPDWTAIGKDLLETIKGVTELIKSFTNIEFEKVMEELSDEASPDKLKELGKRMGKRLLDHILITLLRNLRNVFADEISYCKQLASDVRNQLQDATSELSNNARLLLSEAAQRADEVKNRLGEQAEILEQQIEDGMDPDFYLKVSRTVNGIYAILDLLGLMGTTTIRLKIPDSVLNSINDLKKNVADLPKPLQLSADLIGVSPSSLLQYAEKNISHSSYPITIDIIHWDKLPSLFAEPINYLKGLYQVDSFEQAEQLLTRIMQVARVFNPDVPDFSSIKSMLISLLHKLEDHILTSASEAVKELWKNIEPIVMMIRMIIEMLKDVAKQMKMKIEDLLDEYKALLNVVGLRLEKAFNKIDPSNIQIELPESFSEHELAIKALEHLSTPDLRPYLNADWEGLSKDLHDLFEVSISADKLKDWGNETLEDLKNTISPTEWEKRFEKVFLRLKEEFDSDLKNITSLFTKEGAKKLVADFNGTIGHLFDEIDITDYLKIIRTAASEVAIPNPNLYYDSLCKKLDLHKSLDEEKLAEVWDIIKRRILTPITECLKQLLVDALYELADLFIEDIINDNSTAILQVQDVVKVGKQLQNYQESSSITLEAPNTDALKEVKIELDSEAIAYIKWMSWVIPQAIRLSTRSVKLPDILRFIQDFFGKMPAEAKQSFYDLLPNMPSNGFTDYVKNIGYTLDVESKFFCATLLNLKGKLEDTHLEFNTAAALQVCLFIGENKEGKPAFFVIPIVSANAEAKFTFGKHLLSIELEGEMAELVDAAMSSPNVEFNVNYENEYNDSINRLGV